MNYENLSTIEVIKIAKEKNDDFAFRYLIKKYEAIIHSIIRGQNFYLQGGGEYEDLVQEGYTGLYRAILDYDEENGSSFENFCKTVILRRIITAIKKSTRLKNKPLNEMYSFDKSLPDNDNLTMMDIIGFRDEVKNRSDLDTIDPEEKFILEETERLQKELLEAMLSDKEKNVFVLHIEKKTYKEIMDILGIDNAKEVDNTIQRIKRKFKDIKLFDDELPGETNVNKQKII